MRQVATILHLCCAALCLLGAMLPAGAARAATLTDQAGRSVIVPPSPRRIVALAPSVAEIVCELGAKSALVGATRFSDYPPSVRALPRVGSYVRLDLEKIIALRPDLCVAVRDGNPKQTVDRLCAMGIPVLVLDPSSLSRIQDAVRLLGAALGRQKAATRLTGDMARRLAAIDSTVAQTDSRPRVLFQLQSSPIIAASRSTFLGELIARAGGVSCVTGSAPYPRLTREDIIALAPDVIIAPGMTGADKRAILRPWTRWTSIPAVRTGRLHAVDPDIFNRPSPRILGALEQLVRLLHPDQSQVTP